MWDARSFGLPESGPEYSSSFLPQLSRSGLTQVLHLEFETKPRCDAYRICQTQERWRKMETPMTSCMDDGVIQALHMLPAGLSS